MKDFKSLRIVFMGTPEFAVASLDALVKAGCQIVGVITSPDKPGGRGMLMQQSAVKKYALEHNLKVLQPEKLKNPEFLTELKSLQADLQLVVAFRMLPEAVWNMPPMGTINLHGSLLPQYRGAAPINWALINGETETGVTTFKLKHEIDTGDILLQERIPIGEDETAGDLHDKMKLTGAQLLVKTVMEMANGNLQQQEQDLLIHPQQPAVDHTRVEHPHPSLLSKEPRLKQAPKIHTETCRINWSQPVSTVYNLIRGLSPYPAAFIVLNEKIMKIFSAKKEIVFPSLPEGEYETDGKTFLKFTCIDGYIHLLEVQMEGKKKMSIGEFLRGYRATGSNNNS